MPGLAEKLRERIEAEGPITVEAYMAVCNAHYYATRDPLGVLTGWRASGLQAGGQCELGVGRAFFPDWVGAAAGASVGSAAGWVAVGWTGTVASTRCVGTARGVYSTAGAVGSGCGVASPLTAVAVPLATRGVFTATGVWSV